MATNAASPTSGTERLPSPHSVDGTVERPVMVASPTAAIDLPLKILVYGDADGRTRVAYNTPAYLQSRYGVPADLVQNFAGVEVLAAKDVE